MRGIKPKVFVAENVSGLVKGTAKGYFIEIMRELKASGYRVTCKVLDAQWLGVPQARQRTIFIGVREDLGLEPVHPKPLPYRYSVRDALPWITRMQTGSYGAEWRDAKEPAGSVLASDGTRDHRRNVEANISLPPSRLPGGYGVQEVDPMKPCPTVTIASPGNDLAVPCGQDHKTERRKFTIAELKRICGFPDDFILTGSYAQQWERMGRAVPPVMMAHIAATIRDEILSKI